MIRRAANPALFLTLVVALVVAAFSIGGSLALFTDTDSVPGNTFTTAASFDGLDRANAWTTGLTHTAGSGSDRLLLFVVGYENGADPGVSAATYGGQSLTPIIGAVAGTTTVGRVELWYLNEAGIAAASGSTFSVTWGGATPSQPMYAAATYKHVNQSDPIADSASNSTDTSTPNPITATVNVTDGAMAVSGAISGNNGSYTWGGGWTEGTDQTSGTTTTMSSAENPATADGTDTASATHSGPNRQAIVVAVLNSPTPPVAILDPWTTGTTHTVSAGANRLLLVGVYGEDSGVIASINTVTWGGQTLTEISEATVGTGYSNLVWMGYLDEAGIAAASGSTIVATWSGTTPNESVLYSAATLENVDQTTPIGASSTGTSTSASTVQVAGVLNVSAGDMAAYVTVSGEQGRTHTADTGYTEGTEEDSGGVGQVASNATKVIASAGTEQPMATWSGTNNRLAIVGAIINMAPPPPPAGAVAILDAWTTGTTHAVSAGANRLLLVGVYGEDSGLISSINTVTWGGQTLTEIGEAPVGTGPSNLVWMGYLDEAGIAAASDSTIVATWSGAAPDRSVLYAAATLENVDQTTPIGDSSTGTATSASTVQVAGALNVSPGDMAAYVTVTGNAGLTHTPDTGYTEGTEQDSGGDAQDHVASNATKVIASAGTEQPTATWSGTSVRLGIVGAVIKMAP